MPFENGSDTTGSGGGGILNFGKLTVSDSSVSGNAAGKGGGIANYGTLTVSNDAFSARQKA